MFGRTTHVRNCDGLGAKYQHTSKFIVTSPHAAACPVVREHMRVAVSSANPRQAQCSVHWNNHISLYSSNSQFRCCGSGGNPVLASLSSSILNSWRISPCKVKYLHFLVPPQTISGPSSGRCSARKSSRGPSSSPVVEASDVLFFRVLFNICCRISAAVCDILRRRGRRNVQCSSTNSRPSMFRRGSSQRGAGLCPLNPFFSWLMLSTKLSCPSKPGVNIVSTLR
jgi:hypothetical protein